MLACSFTNFYLVLCQLAARKHVMTCPIREYVYMGAGGGCPFGFWSVRFSIFVLGVYVQKYS